MGVPWGSGGSVQRLPPSQVAPSRTSSLGKCGSVTRADAVGGMDLLLRSPSSLQAVAQQNAAQRARQGMLRECMSLSMHVFMCARAARVLVFCLRARGGHGGTCR